MGLLFLACLGMIIALVTTKGKSLGTNLNQENWTLVIRLLSDPVFGYRILQIISMFWLEIHLEIIEKQTGEIGRCAMRFPLICHAPIFVIGVPEGAQHMQWIQQGP